MKSTFKKIHVSLKGVNLSRIYKECQKNNIELYNINRKDYKNIEFDIEYKNKSKLKDISKFQKYEYQEEQKKGFNKFINFLKYRFGILIGLLFFISVNFFSNFFVWNIKIYGNDRVTNEQIILTLNKNNISVGKIVNTANLQNIETKLSNEIEDISLCSVIKKGTTIIINIKEKLFNQELESDEIGKDIIAPINLTITELFVSNGTALKKVGDSVKKGETIVAGYVLNSNGRKIECKANASINAKTWHTSSVNYPKKKEVTTRTGKVNKQSYLTLFGMKFNIKNSNNTFENFEEEQTEQIISNNFFPFVLHVKKQYEVTKSYVEQNFELDKQKVLKQCQKEAQKRVDKNQEVVKTFDTILEQEDCFVVTSYVEVNFAVC